MTISMYQASAPVFDKMLENLSAILGKAATWAETRKIDPVVLMNARLAPDMFALARQVQIACDFANRPSSKTTRAALPSCNRGSPRRGSS